jgi:hypothetical protein
VRKEIKAHLLKGDNPFLLSDVAAAEMFEQLAKHAITELNWEDYPYQPAVQFSIAYQQEHILLKYYVAEKDIKATYVKHNDPVYKDSCVEFFISFDDDHKYYNFEFNSLGTCLAAYGKKKPERDYLPEHLIDKIKNKASVTLKNGLVNWEITIALPREVFCFHSLESFKGIKAKANFYKCGDDLPEPHFLKLHWLYF